MWLSAKTSTRGVFSWSTLYLQPHTVVHKAPCVSVLAHRCLGGRVDLLKHKGLCVMDKHEQEEWLKVRTAILKRDGYRCTVFGCKVRGSADLSVHHIVPRPQGGNNPENLITLCYKHHNEIELAEVKTATLIRNWTGPDVIGHDVTDMSRTILDGIDDELGGQPVFRISNVPKQHLCADSTVEAIMAIKDGRSWVDVANVLRYEPSFAPTLSQIMGERPGAISLDGEDELRDRLGLARCSEPQYARCATCGHAHHKEGDCLTYAFGVAPTPRQIKQRRQVSTDNHHTRAHRVYVDTAARLAERHTTASWRALAVALGYDPTYAATLSAAARRVPGAMTRAAENDLRQRLGLPARPAVYRSIALPAQLREHLNARRQALGLTWAELLSRTGDT